MKDQGTGILKVLIFHKIVHETSATGHPQPNTFPFHDNAPGYWNLFPADRCFVVHGGTMVQGQLEKRILHHVLQLNQSVSQISIQDGDYHAVTRKDCRMLSVS